MRALLGGLVLAAAVALSACQFCEEGTPPHAVSAQPLGARCAPSPFRAGAECADGLQCIGGRCTISCDPAQAACPAASICVEGARDRDGTLLPICLPTCVESADCLLGATVGTCTSGYCMVRTCTTDDACGGGRCVEASKARGITWNEYCSDGYCQL